VLVGADERADQVGVRGLAVPAVRGDGLVEREIAGREDGRVIDEPAEQRSG
jgi:hypothetical protein